MPFVLAAALASFLLGGALGFVACALMVAGADHPTPWPGQYEPKPWPEVAELLRRERLERD